MIIVTHNAKSGAKTINLLEVDKDTHYAKLIPIEDMDTVKLFLENNKEMVHRRLVNIDRESDFDGHINDQAVNILSEILAEEEKQHYKEEPIQGDYMNNKHTHYTENEVLRFHPLEVLVRMYQHLGILDPEVDGSKLTPNSFTQKSKEALTLLKGRLSNERVVSLKDTHFEESDEDNQISVIDGDEGEEGGVGESEYEKLRRERMAQNQVNGLQPMVFLVSSREHE